MSKKSSVKDIFVFGFALFAMFFGAGNLIFPPYLGIIAGPKWFTAFAGFRCGSSSVSGYSNSTLSRTHNGIIWKNRQNSCTYT